MMAARIDGRRVQCGRRGCDVPTVNPRDGIESLTPTPLGYLDDWQRRGLSLGLSLQWYWDAEHRPPCWRLGKRSRVFSMDPYGPSTERMGAGTGADIMNADSGPSWRIPLPAIIQCHRCQAVQEVGIPLAG